MGLERGNVAPPPARPGLWLLERQLVLLCSDKAACLEVEPPHATSSENATARTQVGQRLRGVAGILVLPPGRRWIFLVVNKPRSASIEPKTGPAQRGRLSVDRRKGEKTELR